MQFAINPFSVKVHTPTSPLSAKGGVHDTWIQISDQQLINYHLEQVIYPELQNSAGEESSFDLDIAGVNKYWPALSLTSKRTF